MTNIPALMTYDPATGDKKPYPSEAHQYRAHHGQIAWLFNPYTGRPRHAKDIGSDTFGLLIMAPQQPVSLEDSKHLCVEKPKGCGSDRLGCQCLACHDYRESLKRKS